ncbi:hypothetical protein [Hymenobacter gelipurpurascens]|uniref:hypothetical protein n=1 Tax=Hymenobacter gelipurpurascens TaxID=89968 RepID=UPI001131A39C|nr:hypothetical protein [Hymenobacter gelipurpurascens]
MKSLPRESYSIGAHHGYAAPRRTRQMVSSATQQTAEQADSCMMPDIWACNYPHTEVLPRPATQPDQPLRFAPE